MAGCASVQMASLEDDLNAKSFEPSKEKASVYIYRNETMGAAVPMTVNVNGRAIGQTAAKTYFKLNLLPGVYNVESTAENISSLALQADKGRNYYLWQEVKMGMWMARTQLSQVDESIGRSGVQESKLVALRVSEAEILPIAAVKSALEVAGKKTETDISDASEKLKQLQKMFDEKLISEQEFNQKRKEILAKL